MHKTVRQCSCAAHEGGYQVMIHNIITGYPTISEDPGIIYRSKIVQRYSLGFPPQIIALVQSQL